MFQCVSYNIHIYHINSSFKFTSLFYPPNVLLFVCFYSHKGSKEHGTCIYSNIGYNGCQGAVMDVFRGKQPKMDAICHKREQKWFLKCYPVAEYCYHLWGWITHNPQFSGTPCMILLREIQSKSEWIYSYKGWHSFEGNLVQDFYW